jgi:hypothetical protein
MPMVTLHCEVGDHTWERPSQRGRRPVNCPEHSVITEDGEPVARISTRKLPPELVEYLDCEPKTFAHQKLAYIAYQVASGKREAGDVALLLETARHILSSGRS